MKKRTLSLPLAVACACPCRGRGGAPAPDAQTSARRGAKPPAARWIAFAASSRPVAPASRTPTTPPCPWGVWEPLITKDGSGKPRPLPWPLEWEHNEDSGVDPFHLREGVTFSNGAPFNARQRGLQPHEEGAPLESLLHGKEHQATISPRPEVS